MVVYAALLPSSNQTYMGRSTLCLEKRMPTNIRQMVMVAGKMRLNTVMSRFGGQRLTFVPLRVWDRGTTKIECFYVEGEYIWTWNPSLNDRRKGESSTGPLGKLGEFLLLGRRRRTRQLLKFRLRGAAKTFVVETHGRGAKDPAVARLEGLQEQQRQHSLFPLIMRMQRRPLKRQHNFEALKTVQHVRSLNARSLRTLLKLAQSVLDAVGRSIFFTNFREIMKGAQSVVFPALNIKTP